MTPSSAQTFGAIDLPRGEGNPWVAVGQRWGASLRGSVESGIIPGSEKRGGIYCEPADPTRRGAGRTYGLP